MNADEIRTALTQPGYRSQRRYFCDTLCRIFLLRLKHWKGSCKDAIFYAFKQMTVYFYLRVFLYILSRSEKDVVTMDMDVVTMDMEKICQIKK